jgi:hypothetical protein
MVVLSPVVPLLFAVITGAISQTHSLLIPCSEGISARPDRLLPEPLLRDDSLLIACSEAIADRSRVPVTVPERPPVDIGRLLGTPPDNGAVVRQKGGLAAGQKITRRLAELSPMMADLVMTFQATLTHNSVPPLSGRVTERNPLDGFRTKSRKSGSALSFMT